MREIELARGHEAKRIVDSPIWAEAWSQYEDKLISAWKNSAQQDEHARERLWMAYQVCQKVKSQIISVIVTGKLAQLQVEELQK